MAVAQPRSFGRAVRYIRKRLGLSRQQFADRLELPLDRLADIENREGMNVHGDGDVVMAVEQEFGLDVYKVANVYVTDPAKMDEPFASLIAKMGAYWREECEAAFQSAR